MPGKRPVFEKGSPLTFFATTVANGGNLKAGMAVEPDGLTGKIKPAGANTVFCLGVAVTHATGSDYTGTAPTTDTWGNNIVSGAHEYPNSVAVAASGVWDLPVVGGVAFGQLVKCGANGTIVPVLSGEATLLTVGGSGLTSFTLTYGGDTTEAIPAAATAAQVQAALEALDTIAPGDIAVTGSAGGPWTVTFSEHLGNVATMTTTPSGGTGTVTPTEATAGGSGTLVVGQAIGRCVEPGGINHLDEGRIRLGVMV